MFKYQTPDLSFFSGEDAYLKFKHIVCKSVTILGVNPNSLIYF